MHAGLQMLTAIEALHQASAPSFSTLAKPLCSHMRAHRRATFTATSSRATLLRAWAGRAGASCLCSILGSRACIVSGQLADFNNSSLLKCGCAVTETGAIRPARDGAEFRGTSLYSSLHAHELKDLARCDDLCRRHLLASIAVHVFIDNVSRVRFLCNFGSLARRASMEAL